MARLLKEYNEELRPKIQKALGLSNPMEIPKVTKITLNMGVGEAVADKKILDNALKDMEKIAGQKPIKTLAKKSVAGFKIRDGYPIGCKVTLRKLKMSGRCPQTFGPRVCSRQNVKKMSGATCYFQSNVRKMSETCPKQIAEKCQKTYQKHVRKMPEKCQTNTRNMSEKSETCQKNVRKMSRRMSMGSQAWSRGTLCRELLRRGPDLTQVRRRRTHRARIIVHVFGRGR